MTKKKLGRVPRFPLDPDGAYGTFEEMQYVDGLGAWDQHSKHRTEEEALRRRIFILRGYIDGLAYRRDAIFDSATMVDYAMDALREAVREYHERFHRPKPS